MCNNILMHSCYAGMYLGTHACVFVCVFGEVSAFAVLKLELDEMTTTMKREKSRIKPFDESIFFIALEPNRWVYFISHGSKKSFLLLLCPLSEHLFGIGISIRTLNF